MSLQNSLACSKLPQHYQIIYENYTNKNYKRVIEKIEDVKEFHVEYSILKAACLIHLNKEIGLAHQILDSLLTTDPNNSYSTYAKGLAFFHESVRILFLL